MFVRALFLITVVTASTSCLSSFLFLSPAVLLHLAGETSSGYTKSPQLGFCSALLRNRKACELRGKHLQPSVNAFITPSSSKVTKFTGTTPLRSSLPPKKTGLSIGSLHGPSSHSMCWASASSGSESSGPSQRRVQRARNALARYEQISDTAHEALASFLTNNYKTSYSDGLDQAKHGLDRKELERNVATAERDVAKADREVLKAKGAPGSEVAEAER